MLIRVAQYQRRLSKLYQRVYFSMAQGDEDEGFSKIPQLSPIKQRALISYYTLEYIMSFDKQNFRTSSNSIRQSLLDKKKFISFIKSFRKANADLILDEKYIDQVLEGFTIGKGCVYNRKVFSQSRFNLAESGLNPILQNTKTSSKDNSEIVNTMDVQALSNLKKAQNQTRSNFGRIVLNPLSYTSKIIHNIIYRNAIMICGQKGTGKSFAYLTYIYCTKFILEFRNSDEYEKQSAIFFQYVDKRTFENIPKLSYIALKQHTTFSKIIQVLQQQNKQVNIQKLENKLMTKFDDHHALKLQLFKIYIEQISRRKNNKNSKLIGCVIDETNFYYQQIRTYIKNSQNYSGMPIMEKSRLQLKDNARNMALWLSKVLSIVCPNFLPRILNSSQNVENLYIREINDNYRQSFFDFFSHDSSNQMKSKIEYKAYLKTKEGQVELYGIMWFQIQIRLNFYQVDQQHIQNYRNIFNKTFNLPPSQSDQIGSDQLTNIQDIDYWKKDVSFYNIRNIIRSKTEKQLIRFFSNNGLKELRKEIQLDRQSTFKDQFSQFFNKGLINEELQRHRFLCYLHQQVQKILNQPSKRNLINTEIFIGLSQGFSKTFFQELHQSLDLLVEQKSSQSFMSCKFNQSPFWVKEQVINSLQNIAQRSVNLMKILQQKNLMNSSAVGQIFQSIAHLFIYPGNLILKVNRFDQKGNKQQLMFDIVKSSYILSEKNSGLEKSLANLVKSAQNNPSRFVAGIPAVTNHPFFDFAIAKFQPAHLQSNKRLEFWLIDYACGELKDKVRKKEEQVANFVKKFSGIFKDYEIQVKFFVGSLNQLADRYASQMMKVPKTRIQKNNIYTIHLNKNLQLPSQKISFTFETIGIPKISEFVSFKQQSYNYPINTNIIYEFMRQAQQLLDEFIKSKTQ